MRNKNDVRPQMMAMISDWKDSGLKQKEYCASKNIAYHVFHYWYGVYRANNNNTNTFIPVKIKTEHSEQQVTIIGPSGVKVELALNDHSTHFVQQWLRG
jgi:hypothetical protein